MKKFNPYSILFFTIIIIIMLYELKWSMLYPKLSIPLATFIIMILIGCIIFDFLLMRHLGSYDFNNESISFEHQKWYGIVTALIVIGTVMDGIYSHGFPLLGAVKYGDTYGIPFVHVLIAIISSFTAYSLAMTLTFEKKFNIKVLIYLLIVILCILLPLSRLLIILTLFNYFWSFLYLKIKHRDFSIKKIITIFLISIIGLYCFGILGNYRINVQTGQNDSDYKDSSLIYEIGVPSQNFINTKIPGPFFWDYIYITSPLANLQNITNNDQDRNANIIKFLGTQLLPDTLSKRLYPEFKQEISNNTYQYQTASVLNVSTIFFQSYYLLGWFGMYFMAIFILIFPIIYIVLISRSSKKNFLFGISVLNTIYILAMFDNMFVLSVLSLQLLIPIILGFKKKKINKKTNG